VVTITWEKIPDKRVYLHDASVKKFCPVGWHCRVLRQKKKTGCGGDSVDLA
jgi:hypothetical protein